MQAYTDLLNRATNTANQPLQQYGGQLVAGFNDTQNQAFNNVSNTAGASQPYTQQASQLVYNSAQPTLGQVPGATQQLMNPYTQQAVGATAAQMQNLFGQQQNQLTGQAIGAGAYGGDRAGVAAGNLANQQALAYGQTISGMENQGYQQAQAAAMNSLSSDANRQAYAGMGLGSLGQQNLQNQLTTGGMQQQLAQENLNIPYEQFVQQQSYPFQTTGWLGNLVEGLGSQMGGNSATYASGPNPIGQVAGLGVAGLGAAGAAGAFSARGGRIERAPGGKASSAGGGDYALYMPTDVPDVSVSPVTGQAPAGLGKGAPGAPGDQSSKGGAGALGGLDSASLKDAFKAGKEIFGKKDGEDDGGDDFSPDDADWTSDWGLGSAGTASTAGTAATAAGDASALEGIELMTIKRGGRIPRSVGGLSTNMPSAGSIADVSASGLGSPDDLTGGGSGGAGKNNIPAPPKMMQVAGDGGGSDDSGQEAEQAIMMAIEVAALANRGGRIHRDSGGLVPSMPMGTDPNATTVPNVKPKIAYAPPGYTPGSIATFGQAVPSDFQMTPMPEMPNYSYRTGSGQGDNPLASPNSGGGGGNARGGRIGLAGGGGTGDPSGQQDYTKLPIDQLNLLHAVTPDDAPQKPKIEQAIQAKQMGLGAQAQPQQQQASVGLMPGSSAAAPQQQPVSLATGLPEPSPMQVAQSMAQGQAAMGQQQQPAQQPAMAALGGPVSMGSQYQGFAGGGLVPIGMRPPTTRGYDLPTDDPYGPYPNPEIVDQLEGGGTGSHWMADALPRGRGTVDMPTRIVRPEGLENIYNRPGRFGKHWNADDDLDQRMRQESRYMRHARGGLVGYGDGGGVGELVPEQEPLDATPEMMPSFSPSVRRDPYASLVARTQAERTTRAQADARAIEAGRAAKTDAEAMASQRNIDDYSPGPPPGPGRRPDVSPATAAILRDRDVEPAPQERPGLAAPAAEPRRIDPNRRFEWASPNFYWNKRAAEAHSQPPEAGAPETSMRDLRFAQDNARRKAETEASMMRDRPYGPNSPLGADVGRFGQSVGDAARETMQFVTPNPETRERFAQDNARRRTDTEASMRQGQIYTGARQPTVDDMVKPSLFASNEPARVTPPQGLAAPDDAPRWGEGYERSPEQYGPNKPELVGPTKPDVYGPNKPTAVAARPAPAGSLAPTNQQLFNDGMRIAHSQPGIAAPGAAARPGLGAPAPGAAPADGAPATAPTAGAAAAAPKPEDTVEARRQKKYDDLAASLAYKPTPVELPKRDAKGNLWSAIMAGGLGMAASSNPNAISQIGEGGLRAMGTYAKAQHDDDTAEQSAKKLHGETERWNKTFAHNQQETVRKAAKDEADERKAERQATIAEARATQQAARDAANQGLQDRRLDLMGQQVANSALVAGRQHNQMTAGRGRDEEGNVVDGAYVFNPNTGATDFRAGVVLTGKGGEKGGAIEHLARGLISEREEMRKTDPTLPALSLHEATAAAQRAPRADSEMLRREGLAQSAARMSVAQNPGANFDTELEKYRTQKYGLPPATAAAVRPPQPKAAAPSSNAGNVPLTADGQIDAAKLTKNVPYVLPGHGTYYWDGEGFNKAP